MMATLAEEEVAMVKAMREAGHEPRLDGVGNVDFLALDAYDPEWDKPHIGPGCAICGKFWCLPCWARGDDPIEPCKGKEQP